jgi:hypothetical protein
VWYHKGHQRHKGSPYSPVNKPKRRVHAPLSDALEGGMRPLHKVLGRAPQLNWRFPIIPPSSYTQRLSLGTASSGWGSKELKSNKSLNEMKGEIKSPWWKCRSRSLPRVPKGLQVLVARMRDLMLSSFATMEEREYNPRPQLEVEDDYLYPSEISSCWGRLTPASPAF